MATITKRNNSYSIRVSCGYDTNGKQVIRSMTWKPPKDVKWSEAKVQKEVQKAAALFEKDCESGYTTAAVKFEEFAEKWFEEYAKLALKPQSVRTYRYLSKRAYKEIGHIRLDKITPRTIQNYVNKLTAEKKHNSKGEEIGTLSPKSVKEHIGFISAVFEYAKKQQLIQNNPCKNVTLPKNAVKEREVYTLEEVQQMLDLFKDESTDNLKYVIFFTIAVYTGLRRGELLALEWKNIDLDNNILYVCQSVGYTKELGVYTETPKTKSSNRFVRFPDEVKQQLIKYKAWQDDYKAKMGDKWEEYDRLFTQANGKPMSVRSPYKWFEGFCKRTGMRFVNVHSFRHFNASIFIANGADIKTVQARLGHANASTTLNIYAHSFQKAQALAMDKVADCISRK